VTRLVTAELLKLRTTRTFWALAAATFALILLIVVLSLILDDELVADEDTVRSLLGTGGLAGLFMLVLGAVVGAGEYRHGTIASTLLVTPNRLRAVAAQTLACALGGLVVGLVATVLVALIALPVLSAKDATLPDTGEIVRTMLGSVLYSGLAAALGVALGAALRNQVAAIVTLLLFIFVADPAITALAEDYAPFSLSGLSAAMTGSTEEEAGMDLLPLGVAALVWAGYTAVLVGLAAFLTARRDI
jgi:ABC-type transport system involved in multi-copper enzyme maturation permease subunit